MVATSTSLDFTAGDLVISAVGDGASTGSYTDNQASPIVLEEITTAGAIVAAMELPQTTTTNANGVTENAISGEYGSSSEGLLSLSADGQSLVIAGYAVNANTYNSGGAAVYGNAALAQSTSVPNGAYTAVARVIADVNYNGVVDTSTALYNVFNENNPRSVATVNGSTFYISGQGLKGDTTQGVFEATDGASSATAIDTSTDTRAVEIYNGELYVSRDSKQGTGGTSNISVYGTNLPNSATAPTDLSGIAGTVTLTAAQENTVNSGAVGTTIHLSPESYFFANATTLYVADGGIPKEGGIGDGGLQKWTYNGSKWMLDYTISQGLNLVANTASAGTTGLIGLTGKVVGTTVELFATNTTVNDLDQTYVFGATDVLGATTAASDGASDVFSVLVTAPADTNIRGIAFAPTIACYCSGTMISALAGEQAVEDLRIGDILLTARGEQRPIKWIGRRSYAGRFLAANPGIKPIRFRAGSLGGGLPQRDLLVSPDHAMFLHGILVPAKALVNGGTIRQEHGLDRVDYYHVELDSHDIILAEGAASETFLDDDSRGMFHNAAEYAALYPDAPAQHGFCTQRFDSGHEVEAVRQALAAISVDAAAA